MRCIAVDWSGAQQDQGQLEGIWLAIAENQSLTRLMNGLTRDEVCGILVNEIKSGTPLVIGLDFAFSFPKWYLQTQCLNNIRALWELAEYRSEEWAIDMPEPFWGKRANGSGRDKPDTLKQHSWLEYRETDEELRRKNLHPKSVFQLLGAGAVGTGTVRGLPYLARLQDAGAAIWPFDHLRLPVVVEIYPRSLYGNGVTNNKKVAGRNSRNEYLGQHYSNIEQHWRDIMVGNDNAFDAGVSALVMAAHTDSFRKLSQTTDSTKQLEGEIWRPCL